MHRSSIFNFCAVFLWMRKILNSSLCWPSRYCRFYPYKFWCAQTSFGSLCTHGLYNEYYNSYNGRIMGMDRYNYEPMDDEYGTTYRLAVWEAPPVWGTVVVRGSHALDSTCTQNICTLSELWSSTPRAVKPYRWCHCFYRTNHFKITVYALYPTLVGMDRLLKGWLSTYQTIDVLHRLTTLSKDYNL